MRRASTPAGKQRFWHEPLRRRVVGVIAGPQGPTIDYDAPSGDAGLFGPHSVTWRIHSDFPAMMSGGICALMLQTLHPRALAGVWDHSNFRGDLLGRALVPAHGRIAAKPRSLQRRMTREFNSAAVR